MEIQHVNVKLFVSNADGVDLEAVIPVFHSWIQDQSDGELLLDVADYRHVQSGPGVVLIGHEGSYSLDNTDGRLGVRYNRKTVLEGTNQDRLVQATQAALASCQRLEAEPRLEGEIQFNGREIEVLLNDRLLTPNGPETRQAVDSESSILSFRPCMGTPNTRCRTQKTSAICFPFAPKQCRRLTLKHCSII